MIIISSISTNKVNVDISLVLISSISTNKVNVDISLVHFNFIAFGFFFCVFYFILRMWGRGTICVRLESNSQSWISEKPEGEIETRY